MKLSGVSDSGKTNGEAAVPSIPVKPVAQTGDSSGDLSPPVRSNQSAKSVPLPASTSVLGAKPLSLVSSSAKYKAIARDNVGEMITFKDMTFGPHEGEVRFQLIHFWEAWNAQTKVLIGLEMLLIDEEENVIQGFILYGRIKTYLRHMKAGATYRLNKFFGSKSKTIYRVAEPSVTISFSWNSVLSVLEDSSICFPEDRFRIHGYREFEAASDLRGDLYGSSDSIMLDEAEIVASRRVDLHVQTHDDPVLKLYLWDKAAFEFCEKFKAPEGTARVISQQENSDILREKIVGNKFPRKLRGPPVRRKRHRNIPRENFLGIFRWTFRWSNPRKFRRNVPRNFHWEFPRNGALGKIRGKSPSVYSEEEVPRYIPRAHFLGI
uniref:DUF223 domain-containing protein n=1 Tax=Brassica oleracea var. oleracea TaxID=109376 RepID=A0A0D3BHY5_BRAOL